MLKIKLLVIEYHHKLIVNLTALIILMTASSSAQSTFDFDGNSYSLQIIGSQTWMRENLNVSHFRNGDPIPQITNSRDWIEAWRKNEPAWCYPENSDSLGRIYGKLYNWFAVNDPRGLAPKKFRIPNFLDFKYLCDFIGNNGFNGAQIKNTSFDLQIAGYRDILTGFDGRNKFSSWWTSEISNSDNAWSVLIGSNFGPRLQKTGGVFGNGTSVRCILDE